MYRTVGNNRDGSTAFQDELYPRNANNGVQFNYEVNLAGMLTKYSESSVFSELMQQCIDLIQPLVSHAGSSIISWHRDFGEEAN